MGKDRSHQLVLLDGVVIVVERSSAHPIEYAIRLSVHRNGEWRTVRLFDNAHGSEEHHEHCYIGSQKQQPTVTRGPVNRAMADAMRVLKTNWRDIVDEWERTR